MDHNVCRGDHQPMIPKISILAALVAFCSSSADARSAAVRWAAVESVDRQFVGGVRSGIAGWRFSEAEFSGSAACSRFARSAQELRDFVANEDYIAWGAVEREPGKWEWRQHDAMEQALHKAGLKYVVYNWVHFPPVWLREQPAKRTLMKCLEHGEETNYLSIFDPRTIEWYDHFYKNVHEHFGDRVDDIYACILGPYGEGNYPLAVPDWINMGHCHEGYWCGDEYAIEAFQTAMERKYGEYRPS